MFLLPLVLTLAATKDETLRVEGNHLTFDGQPIVLRGVNVPSLEWSNRGERVFRSVRVAIEDWKANCIRLPLCEDRWFGRAPDQDRSGERYRIDVDEIVNYVARSDGFVVLDLHWSDAGTWGKNLGQHKMPDVNSEVFWKEIAKKFRGNGRVLFGLYNEPHDVDWNTWLDGGQVVEDKLTYKAVGMRQLLKDVRSMSAKNVVVVGGLDWAYDFTGVSGLTETNGNGIMYDAHIYPSKKNWDHFVGERAATSPVLIGEAGCTEDPKQESPRTWVPKLLGWVKKNNVNFTAWCLHPTATPNLVSDWVYTPTPFWGSYVKDYLAKSAESSSAP